MPATALAPSADPAPPRDEASTGSAGGNFWSDAKCAKAFWSQCELPVFQRLVADTLDLAAPAAGETWLDLGCGGGTLTRAIWDRTHGRVNQIVGLDTAAINANRYAELAAQTKAGHRIRFLHANFSHGLASIPDESFDHVISGLSITYAEHSDPTTGQWTQQAYDQLLAEVFRILSPGGRFVFSVNVPHPSWWSVGLRSLPQAVARSGRPLKFLKNLLRMHRYGAWLKTEAAKGRFHYLPANVVTAKLRAAGFATIRHQLSYAKQAFVFCAEKMG